ncbi:MAG: Tetratricopeptide repeat-like domain [Verrucomicrobiota bacterium]|jgi:tetratricopeptide (TPR) repeat protein
MAPEEIQSSWQIDVLAWFEKNKLNLAYAGAAGLAVWLAAFTYKHVRTGKEAEANAALAALSKPADKAGKSAPPLASEYLRVAEQHAGTPAGERASLYAADRLFTEGKFPEAKARFEKYLATNPTGPTAATALMGVAACQEAAGDADKAIATYGQVLTQHGSAPEAQQAKLALGMLHELKKQPELALRQYDAVLSAKPATVWRMEAEMRREQLVRLNPQLVPGTPAVVAPASTVVLPATNAPVKVTLPVKTNAPAKK